MGENKITNQRCDCQEYLKKINGTKAQEVNLHNCKKERPMGQILVQGFYNP